MMNASFAEFLVSRDVIPVELAARLTEQIRHSGEPIGMIAVDHAMLQIDQIDEILDRQRTSNQRFGDIAVEMGFMSREQVEALVKIQEFRALAKTAEILVLGDVLAHEDVTRLLGIFLTEDREVMEIAAGD